MDTDLQIVKSNQIIEASYRLSVAEQRVILSAISQVRRDKPVTDEVLYSVTAADLAELCGTDPKTAYRDLQNAAERLQTRRVSLILEPDGVTIRSKRRRVTCWVQTVDYIDQEGRVEMRFGKDILPYLTGLQREFTRYALSDVAKMTSAYGIRLYELLVQWKGGHREVALDDLRRWLQLEDRYPSIKDFKRWVLDPAVEQINEHSPLMLTWSQRKTGRKVTHLVFDYAPKKPAKAVGKAPAKRKAGKISDAEIAKQARPGETWEAARARLNQMPLDLA
ncbi:replication initiation protein [Pseudomonas helleri]|jgi:plasmid replication initiation protein|uniref:replication initiation protein n=1 Tax=Pseudomonas helleri TaxID=1608996 RepID=UPI003FD240BB